MVLAMVMDLRARHRHGEEQFSSGDAKVRQLCGTILADEHVLGFYIAVHHAQRVGRRQPLGDLDTVPGGTFDPELDHALDDPRKTLGQELQRDEVSVAVQSHLEDFHDVRVVYGCGKCGLATEALDVGSVSYQCQMQHLEGNDPPAIGVIGPIDRPLAARGDLFEYLVAPYLLVYSYPLQAQSVPRATARLSLFPARLPYH